MIEDALNVGAGGSSSHAPVLAAKTSAGLHDFALCLFKQFAREPVKVLDLGAGTGAWAQRLMALGHSVTCVDQNISGFGLESTHFCETDLNSDFSTAIKGTYGAITAIEVIEHLENPRHFLRQCSSKLDKSGVVLLTTPNIESVAGRLRFLFSGQFRMFGSDIRQNDPTHITPIQTCLFEKMISETGYRVLLHDSNDSKTSRLGVRLVSAVIAPFVSGFKQGDHHVFVLSRS